MNLYYFFRRVVSFIGLSSCVISFIFVMFWLLWILLTLCSEGLRGFSYTVLTEMTLPPGEFGGLANAIWGSFLLTGLAILIAAPTGILAAAFLAEYAGSSWFASATRFLNDILLSAPSIVIGLFVYEIAVRPMGHFSGWAGVIALAIIALPLVLRTTENMIFLIPNNLREAAAALGAPKWVIITRIIYPLAIRGIVTGILLAIARISGETAPLLFTALNNQFWSSNLNQPIANLPNTIFKYAMSPYADWQRLAWNACFIITIWVLFCNVLVRTLLVKKRP